MDEMPVKIYNIGREKARDGWRGYVVILVRRSVYYKLEAFLLFKKGVDSSLSSYHFIDWLLIVK